MGFLRRLLGRGEDGDSRGRDELAGPRGAHEIHCRLARGGQTVSLRQLRSYGLNAVRVLDAPTIHQVVREAVNEVLELRPPTAPRLTGEERAKVEEATKQHVLRLMQQNEALSLDRNQAVAAREQAEAARTQVEARRAELERQIQALREELAGRQSELQEERARTVRTIVVVDDESFVEMERRIQALFERMARTGELEGPDGKIDLGGVQRELRELLGHVIADVKAKHVGADEARVEELELRIEKLSQALANREDAIRRLAEAKGFDPGLASIYDDIQGLDPAAADYQRKAELLKEVFVQNLELHGLDARALDLLISAAPAGGGGGGSDRPPLSIPTSEPAPVSGETGF